MAVFRTSFQRISFDFDPPVRQTSDVVFKVDEDEYTEDNYSVFDAAAWDACYEQNPHWFDGKHERPMEGYAGYSSVLHAGDGFQKVEDIDLDFNLGTPGEGKPRIAECFIDHYSHNPDKPESYRVTAFYKRYVPESLDVEDKDMFQINEILDEIREEELSRMTATQRKRKENTIKVVQCSREEAEFVSGAGVSGVIRRIEDVTVYRRVDWEDRTIARHRRDYRIHDDWPTDLWMYWTEFERHEYPEYINQGEEK